MINENLYTAGGSKNKWKHAPPTSHVFLLLLLCLLSYFHFYLFNIYSAHPLIVVIACLSQIWFCEQEQASISVYMRTWGQELGLKNVLSIG